MSNQKTLCFIFKKIYIFTVAGDAQPSTLVQHKNNETNRQLVLNLKTTQRSKIKHSYLLIITTKLSTADVEIQNLALL